MYDRYPMGVSIAASIAAGTSSEAESMSGPESSVSAKAGDCGRDGG